MSYSSGYSLVLLSSHHGIPYPPPNLYHSLTVSPLSASPLQTQAFGCYYGPKPQIRLDARHNRAKRQRQTELDLVGHRFGLEY